ncbi:BnaC06g15890D [Brassica napus]|uniref:BnaC06g15890D protein n=1 Tax=Brassica napus TaxID=3708 RepID=A0A078H2K2_BRANA|nr:BnaC06g15890D [Brassica napus]
MFFYYTWVSLALLLPKAVQVVVHAISKPVGSCCSFPFAESCRTARSAYLFFYPSSSVANRTFPEDPKTNPLSRPLPFSATKSGVCSYSLSKTDSGNKRFNNGFINALWLRYGNIGVRSRFLAKDSAFPPNPVKHLCFYTGLKVARATSSDSSIIHRHLVSEALYPIALSHMSPWCRPKLAISSSRVCSVSSPNLRLLKLQSCSPLRLYFADKFIKSSSRQDQERSLSTTSFSEERTFPPPLLSMRDRHIPIEISEKLFNSFTVLLSQDATRLVFVMCSGDSTVAHSEKVWALGDSSTRKRN